MFILGEFSFSFSWVGLKFDELFITLFIPFSSSFIGELFILFILS